MNDKMKPQQDLNETMLALREEFEQTAVPIEDQPEPKQGKELKKSRFPKIISYMMGAVAVMMLVAAVFLFNMQNEPARNVAEAGAADVTVGSAVETAVNPDSNQPIPTPPLLVAPPPPPEEAIPLPPEPTPWPTPPIAPDETG